MNQKHLEEVRQKLHKVNNTITSYIQNYSGAINNLMPVEEEFNSIVQMISVLDNHEVQLITQDFLSVYNNLKDLKVFIQVNMDNIREDIQTSDDKKKAFYAYSNCANDN